MNKLLFFIIANVLLVSCSDIVLDESTVTNQNVKNELVAYPMRNHATRAGGTSDVGYWESWEKVKIAELEEPVRTPWNETGTSGAIPNEIRKDIKYKDGWNLIAHTVNGKGEKGLNYLIFYNRYTGILKGFYHSSDNIPNNTGIWHLHFEQPQSFLAFSNPIAELSSARTKNDIYIVNVTAERGKPFTGGWNCFQTELAYDPNFSEGSLQIIPENLSLLNASFGGDLDAYTEGAIITATSSNPLKSIVNGVAKVAGTKAEEWVGNAVKQGKFKKIKNLVVSGAGEIVKSGVGSLLGSFIGGFDKTGQTTQAVNLHTTGTVKLDGDISTVQSSTIVPLSMSISVKDVGRLGVWCLTQIPKIYLSPYAIYVGRDADNDNCYKYQFRPPVDNSQTNLVVNPDLVNELCRKNICSGQETYLRSSSTAENLGESYWERFAYPSRLGNMLYDDTYDANGHSYTVSLPLLDKNGQILEGLDDTLVPYEIFLPNAPGGYKGASPNICCPSHYKSVFGVRLTTKNGDTVQLYHTFIPRLEWDYSRFDNDKMYLHEYPTIPIGESEE